MRELKWGSRDYNTKVHTRSTHLSELEQISLVFLEKWDAKHYMLCILMLIMVFSFFYSILYASSFQGLLLFPLVVTRGILLLSLETQVLLIKNKRQCSIRRKCLFFLFLFLQRKQKLFLLILILDKDFYKLLGLQRWLVTTVDSNL